MAKKEEVQGTYIDDDVFPKTPAGVSKIFEGPDAAAVLELESTIAARCPIIFIVTPEERRILKLLRLYAVGRDKEMECWDCADGPWKFTQDEKEGKWIEESIVPPDAKDKNYFTPLVYLDRVDTDTEVRPKGIDGVGGGKLYVMLDLNRFFPTAGESAAGSQIDPVERAVVRKLRSMRDRIAKQRKHVIIISREPAIPDDIKELCSVIEWPLPKLEGIFELLKSDLVRRMSLRIAKKKSSDELTAKEWAFTDEEIKRLAKAFQGLTVEEIRTEFKRASIRCGDTLHNTEAFLNHVKLAKKEIIGKSRSGLQYFETEDQIDDVGGLGVLKEWLRRRGGTWTDEAKDYGIEAPKGLLMVGVPGCGKSLTAKAIGNKWGLPVLRCDFGAMFKGLVGSSEAAIREAIRMAEAVAPCVFWIDEVEKGLAGVGSSDKSDGGTAARVFGTFITWLNEKKSPVFVVATANNVTQLPPELVRKGRFDEMFFVDLPNESERREIFAIHLAHFGRDPKKFDIDLLARSTDTFSGAEIKECIKDAMNSAYNDDESRAKNGGKPREFDTDDIMKAIQFTFPLAKTREEVIRELREWALKRCVFASEAAETREELTRRMRDRNLIGGDEEGSSGPKEDPRLQPESRGGAAGPDM